MAGDAHSGFGLREAADCSTEGRKLSPGMGTRGGLYSAPVLAAEALSFYLQVPGRLPPEQQQREPLATLPASPKVHVLWLSVPTARGDVPPHCWPHVPRGDGRDPV